MSTTQSRLMKEFRVSSGPTAGRKVAPVVAPKPKYNPLANRTAQPFARDHATEDLPPPPAQLYEPLYTEYQSGGDDLPPPPPPPPTVPSSAYKFQPQRVAEPAAYRQTATAAKPSYTTNSAGSSIKQTSQPSYNVKSLSTTGYTPSSQSAGYRAYSSNLDDQFPDLPAASHVPKASEKPLRSPDKSGKEAEVDALTSMLLQSLDSPSDNSPDVVGLCTKCSGKVTADNSGCTAMDKTYHVSCFTCHMCDSRLQGESFYAMEGMPYCEACYMVTLEKCSVCSKPITERILRATGKPYHPECFTCVVCRRTLDNIPFTVDAANQIHCIEDFHKKFAPRCCVCELPIMPATGQEETVRVVAMDRSFHVHCYKCEDCSLVLSSEAEGRGCYPLDDHILCKNCNARRIQAMTSKMTTEL